MPSAVQLQAAKYCHCEGSEAVSRLWGLLRHFIPRNYMVGIVIASEAKQSPAKMKLYLSQWLTEIWENNIAPIF